MNIKDIINSKILSQQDCSCFVKNLKKQNKKIVFTNGCFDVLHYGHISYLIDAKQLGDKLIVALNSDASVKRLKGENRPINNEYQRALNLAALLMVDAIVVFNEDTPEKIIKLISPDVLVKGGDYKIENIVGADFVMNNGGKVEIINFVNGFSSSEIIKKIQNN